MAKKKARKMSFRGKVKKDNKNHEQSGGKYDILKLPEGVEIYKQKAKGTTKFDIIPYIVSTKNHPDKDSVSFEGEKETIAYKGDPWYKRPYKVHKEVGADDVTVVCLESFGKPCPICEYKKEQQEKGTSWEELKIYKPKDRVLYAIKPIDNDKLDKEFYILDISFYLFQKKLNEETNEDEDFEDFPLLEDGYTLKIRWVEGSVSKKGQEYYEVSRIDFVKRDEDYDESILDEVPDLDSLLIEMPYDKMKALFFEDEVDEDEDSDEEEEDEKPFKEEKKKTSKKTKAKKEPEPEEEDEFTWEDLKEMELDDLAEICEQYGIDAEEVVDDEEDEETQLNLIRKAIAEEVSIEVPKKKKKATKAKEKPAKKKSKSKAKVCPEEDGEFGVDTDELEACDECALLEACIAKNEEN